MEWRLRVLPGPFRVAFERGETRERETRCPEGLGHIDPPGRSTWKETLSLSISLNSAFSSRPLSRSKGYRKHF